MILRLSRNDSQPEIAYTTRQISSDEYVPRINIPMRHTILPKIRMEVGQTLGHAQAHTAQCCQVDGVILEILLQAFALEFENQDVVGEAARSL